MYTFGNSKNIIVYMLLSLFFGKSTLYVRIIIMHTHLHLSGSNWKGASHVFLQAQLHFVVSKTKVRVGQALYASSTCMSTISDGRIPARKGQGKGTHSY